MLQLPEGGTAWEQGQACHTPSLKEASGNAITQRQSHIPSLSSTFWDGTEDVSSCFWAFSRGGLWQTITNPFSFSERILYNGHKNVCVGLVFANCQYAAEVGYYTLNADNITHSKGFVRLVCPMLCSVYPPSWYTCQLYRVNILLLYPEFQ